MTQELIERPANVRLAKPEDEDDIYNLLLEMQADNGFGIPVNEGRVREAIRGGTENKGGLIGVIEGKKGQYGEEGELAASIALQLTQFWYSDEWFLNEGWLFVRPEYRFNHFDKDLWTFAKWCRQAMSKDMNQEMCLVSSMWATNRLPAKLRLWRRNAEQVGGIFLVK